MCTDQRCWSVAKFWSLMLRPVRWWYQCLKPQESNSLVLCVLSLSLFEWNGSTPVQWHTLIKTSVNQTDHRNECCEIIHRNLKRMSMMSRSPRLHCCDSSCPSLLRSHRCGGSRTCGSPWGKGNAPTAPLLAAPGDLARSRSSRTPCSKNKPVTGLYLFIE